MKLECASRLDVWFASRLQDVKCSEDTKAYVTGIMCRFRSAQDDMSNESIVLAYADAKRSGQFVTFQRIGDWTVWIGSMYPARIEQHREVTESIARLSFYTCHRLLNGKWRVFEELADDLPKIVNDVHNCLLL